MATLLLTAVGTAIGGPLGGSIGVIIGQQVDGTIFGGSGREGPWLEELSVTTSSYGQPVARHHGHVRAAGTIIWATDLKEDRERSSSGKGQPKVTTYSYSSSFAVALASRPIKSVGRIWADGNLLRGEAGDLKVGGALRIYKGLGDQPADPLIAAKEGAACPAHRGCAYAVFEDLQLADFGNGLPALTFEIIADDGTLSLTSMIETLVPASSDLLFNDLAGFTMNGGTLSQTIATLDQVYPVAVDAGGDELSLDAALAADDGPILLPEPASGLEDSDFGEQSGRSRIRDTTDEGRPSALRYYDTGRDYLPGLQRAEGRTRPGHTATIEFPGALGAESARGLANGAAQRASWRRETLSWRLAELDPELMPGPLYERPAFPAAGVYADGNGANAGSSWSWSGCLQWPRPLLQLTQDNHPFRQMNCHGKRYSQPSNFLGMGADQAIPRHCSQQPARAVQGGREQHSTPTGEPS
ncbi:phage tail protein [Sphingomonadaceae bacterium]|nr:phage tail protein [Sphingomonadaceae bacterium]